MRQALTPTPHSARAASSMAKLPASAKATQPSTATDKKPKITRRGP